jgi:hypothetical protein
VKTTRIDELIAPQETPLVVRARFDSTFFGLVLFTTVVLMLSGIYLFTEVMLEPLKADDTSIIASGFTLAPGNIDDLPHSTGETRSAGEARKGKRGAQAVQAPLADNSRYSHAGTEAHGAGSRGSEKASRTVLTSSPPQAARIPTASAFFAGLRWVPPTAALLQRRLTFGHARP